MTRYTLPALLLLAGCTSPQPEPHHIGRVTEMVSAPLAPTGRTRTAPFVFVAWDAVPGASGYRIHWGTNRGNYSRVYDAGTNLIQRVEITNGTNYFAVTSCGLFGIESEYSPELAWKPDGAFWSRWFDLYPVVLVISKADPSKPLLVSTNLADWTEDHEHSETNVFRHGPGGKFWRNGKLERNQL
jgi:hypothetical protein